MWLLLMYICSKTLRGHLVTSMRAAWLMDKLAAASTSGGALPP